MIHINLSSPAGNYSVGSTPFFRYVVRLSDMGQAIGRLDPVTVRVPRQMAVVLGIGAGIGRLRPASPV